MSDVPQTTSLIILAQEYAGDIVDQINRTAMFLRLVPIKVGEGKNVAWVAEKSGALSEAYLEGADAANFGSDGQTSATLNWAQYRSNFHLTGLAMQTSSTSSTPQGNVALWARNLVKSSAELASKLNLHCFSGDGTASPKELTGLDAAIGSTSNTYATINRATGGNEYWQPYLVNPGADTDVSFSQIRTDLRTIYVNSGETPDVAICHPGVFDAIGGLFDSSRQYVVDTLKTSRGTIQLDGGYTGLNFNGTVFLRDKSATLESGNTSGRIYYLNTNHMELQVVPQVKSPTLVPETMLRANDGFGDIPLMFGYHALAKNGDSERAMVNITAELKIEKPNAFGVRRFVKVAA